MPGRIHLSRGSLYESGRGNVARLFAALQFFKQTKRVRAAPNLGVSVGQKADDSRAAVGSGNPFFQLEDRFLGMMIGDKRKAEDPKSECVVWCDRQHAAKLLYCVVITAGIKQHPGEIGTRCSKRIELAGPTACRHCLLGTPLTYQPVSKC